MNILLFIVTLAVSFIAIRIGAIAFELTGLQWSLAKFQALSCFTGTGFTTREAELITANPQRRRIASILIILGHAGLVALIATFANSLSPNRILPEFVPEALRAIIPSSLMPIANLTIILVAIYVIYKISNNVKFAQKLTDILRARILKKELVKRVSFEELVVATGGYGVSQVEVCENSPILNIALRDSKLRQQDITILAIERKGITIPNPSADTKLLMRDRLICFGKLGSIRKNLCPART